MSKLLNNGLNAGIFQLMMSDIDNHQRMVNELAERVANLEALSENPEITDSLQDVQNRYDRVRTRCRVNTAYLCFYVEILHNNKEKSFLFDK